MKPKEDIERFVRRGKPHVATGGRMDKRTLNDSFAAMDETIRAKSAAHKPRKRRIIIQSRTTRFAVAAAAVIVVAIGLFMADRSSHEPQPDQTANAVKSPAEMLTAMSLNMAWRRGGIEAMDEQSSEAFEMLGTKPSKVSIQELLAESNGV